MLFSLYRWPANRSGKEVNEVGEDEDEDADEDGQKERKVADGSCLVAYSRVGQSSAEGRSSSLFVPKGLTNGMGRSGGGR